MGLAPLTELPEWAACPLGQARDAGEEIASALRIATEVGIHIAPPGHGQTLTRWTVLAELGRANLTVARVVEAHTDALAILHEAGERDGHSGTWGVFAAEAPGQRLDATVDGAGNARLDGIKPWCSLGHALDNALVTAHVGAERQLFAVDLNAQGVRATAPEQWVARGLRTVTSVPISFEGAPARPVGSPGWYLSRPGFAWGGIGVAACWHGGALGLADSLVRSAASGSSTRPLTGLHVGTVDALLHASNATLESAARSVDTGEAYQRRGELLALRVRAVVADAVERVLRQVGHALGPAPLAFDAAHAARVADLELYVRQHHAERDLDALGSMVLDEDVPS